MDERFELELAQIRQELSTLVFPSFTESDAWDLGNLIRSRAVEKQLPIAIDIRVGDAPVFASMLEGASAENFDWARRKRNLTLLTNKSSWEISRLLAAGNNLIELMGLSLRDYAPHGGCVPIRVKGVSGIVATLTISGLPQKQDHEFAVDGIRDYLNSRSI